MGGNPRVTPGRWRWTERAGNTGARFNPSPGAGCPSPRHGIRRPLLRCRGTRLYLPSAIGRSHLAALFTAVFCVPAPVLGCAGCFHPCSDRFLAAKTTPKSNGIQPRPPVNHTVLPSVKHSVGAYHTRCHSGRFQCICGMAVPILGLPRQQVRRRSTAWHRGDCHFHRVLTHSCQSLGPELHPDH